tara:strand:+ start:378 stop:515 length:138 start_codon:yes stop_codon:yes gene_type:complete
LVLLSKELEIKDAVKANENIRKMEKWDKFREKRAVIVDRYIQVRK